MQVPCSLPHPLRYIVLRGRGAGASTLSDTKGRRFALGEGEQLVCRFDYFLGVPILNQFPRAGHDSPRSK